MLLWQSAKEQSNGSTRRKGSVSSLVTMEQRLSSITPPLRGRRVSALSNRATEWSWKSLNPRRDRVPKKFGCLKATTGFED